MCFVGPVRRPRVDEGERLLLVVPTRNWSWSSGLLGLGVLLRLVRELNCELAWLLLQLGLLLLVYLACWTHWARNLLHLGVPGCSKCAVFTVCVGYYMRFLIYRKMEVSRQGRSAGRGALSLNTPTQGEPALVNLRPRNENDVTAPKSLSAHNEIAELAIRRDW